MSRYYIAGPMTGYEKFKYGMKCKERTMKASESPIGIIRGYKATDKNMKCLDFQFELGKWYEHEGPIEECKSGFHFCEQPSGPWAYYSNPGTRIFRVECEGVLDKPAEPGVDVKRVCRRIRLVEEVVIGGHLNTGDLNTGDLNTGNRNTGNRNTGNRNTGNWNTGDLNTGHWNTGNYNTGNRNTGNRNTGDSNSGDWNTGDKNTGYGNATDRCSGFFCVDEPKVLCFDVQTDLTHDEFCEAYPQWYLLCEELHTGSEIDFKKYKMFPGITPEKLEALHQKHLAAKVKK